MWAESSKFVSSSIPSWQILTAHAQSFRGATDLAFCLKVPLDSLLVWASSEGSGETAQMCRLAWTFAARIGDKYQIRLTRSMLSVLIRIASAEAILMSAHNICFYGERTKITLQLSSNAHLICSTAHKHILIDIMNNLAALIITVSHLIYLDAFCLFRSFTAQPTQ